MNKFSEVRGPIIVWVEIGRKLPRHLINNIYLHRELYPELHQILVTDADDTRKVIEQCEIIHTSELAGFHKDIKELENRIQRSTKQLDFWINTTARFLALKYLLNIRREFDFIHLESDCVLLSYDAVRKQFNGANWGMAYPLQATGVGCASILLLRKPETLSRFINLVGTYWSEKNQDDMQLLGLFTRDSEVLILPSFGPHEDLFDAQTYGRFLFGTDARNMRWPFSRRGIVDYRLGAVNPNKCKFTLDERDYHLEIKVTEKNVEHRLVNIHIHSKRVPKTKAKFEKFLSKEVNAKRTRLWTVGRLDIRVFKERVLSWIYRKVFRIKVEIRLR